MTKSQSNQAFQTASGQNATQAGNAQSSYAAATGDIGDYKDALAKFNAQNPYVQGGQFQTAQNQQLADTAAAGADAGRQAMQSAAVRSGLNPAAAIAAGEQVAETNSRNQMGTEAQATEDRLKGLTQYNDTSLNASAEPEKMAQGLLSTETSGADQTLGTEQDASKTPSFWQELGQGVIQAGGSFAGGFGQGLGKNACWIAARVFDGWDDPRTKLVRLWLRKQFSRSWYGALLYRMYIRYGEWVAKDLMERSRIANWFFTRVFHVALARAEEWLATTDGRRTFELSAAMGVL